MGERARRLISRMRSNIPRSTSSTVLAAISEREVPLSLSNLSLLIMITTARKMMVRKRVTVPKHKLMRARRLRVGSSTRSRYSRIERVGVLAEEGEVE